MNKFELKKVIGNNIKKYRKLNKEKLTQEDLAKDIGVKRALIGALESDSSDVCLSIYNLYKISKRLNVRIDKFFEEALWKRKYLSFCLHFLH